VLVGGGGVSPYGGNRAGKSSASVCVGRGAVLIDAEKSRASCSRRRRQGFSDVERFGPASSAPTVSSTARPIAGRSCFPDSGAHDLNRLMCPLDRNHDRERIAAMPIRQRGALRHRVGASGKGYDTAGTLVVDARPKSPSIASLISGAWTPPTPARRIAAQIRADERVARADFASTQRSKTTCLAVESVGLGEKTL